MSIESGNTLVFLWNTPQLDGTAPNLCKPARWCMRNLQALTTTEAKTFFGMCAEKIKKFALAIFSALAIVFTLPFAYASSQKKEIKPIQKHEEFTKNNGLDLDHQKSAANDLKSISSDQLDNDWNLLRKIGHVRMINLDRNPERFEESIKNLNEIGLHSNEVQRLPAILGDHLPRKKTARMDNNHKNYDPIKQKKEFENLQKRQTGCYMSHYTVIKEAKANYDKALAHHNKLEGDLQALQKQAADPKMRDKLQPQIDETSRLLNIAKANVRKYSSVLVVEDDNRMGRQTGDFSYTLKQTGLVFRKVMQELPDDYDMIFLTAQENIYRADGGGKDIPNKKWIRKILDCWDGNCYVVHSRFYQNYLDQLKKIEDDTQGKINAVDRELPKIFPQNKIYLATPPLALQGGFISTITQGGQVDPFEQRHRDRWNTVADRMKEVSA